MSKKSTTRRVVLAAVAASVLAGASVPVVQAATQTEAAAEKSARDAVQRGLDALVRDDKFPGALAAVANRGQNRTYTSGVADIRDGGPVRRDSRVRIASNTKMFTAVVVLQLVGEGKLSLDDSVEKHLPGVLRGEGVAAGEITVRHLLQHTSGLPDYDDKIFADLATALRTHFEPRDLVDAALTEPALSAPGAAFNYSNTNFVLSGLIAQRVSGRPISVEVTERIIKPLKLRDTYWPGVGEQTLRGTHPRGYLVTGPDAPLLDATESDPSAAWSAGALVSTPADLNQFMTALVGGKLLPPAQLAQMQTTVDAPGFDTVGGARYGLGIATFALSCGGFAWSHGGLAPGYATANGVTQDGKHAATVAVTALPSSPEAMAHLEGALDTALCQR